MGWLVPSMIATMIGTGVLTAVYFFLFVQYRERHMAIWGCGWLFYVLRLVIALSLVLVGQSFALNLLFKTVTLLSGLFLLWGTYAFLGRKITVFWLFAGIAGFFWVWTSQTADFSFMVQSLPLFLFLGLTNIWVGILFLRYRGTTDIGKYITGWAFILWGLHKIDFPFMRPVAWFAPWGYLLASLLALIVALGMLLVYFRRMREVLLAREQEIHQQNILIEASFASSPDGIILTDPDWRILRINKGVTTIFGYEPEDLIGHEVSSLFESRELYEQLGRHRLTLSVEERCKPFQASYRRKNGDIFCGDTISSSLRGADEELIGHYGVIRDISTQVARDDELREREQQYRVLFEDSHAETLLIDPNSGEIVDANRSACTFYGYDRSELQARKIFDLNILPKEQTLAKMASSLRQGQERFEFQHRLADGSVRDVEVHTGPISVSGRDLLYSIVQDVTERRQTEEMIQAILATTAGLVGQDYFRTIVRELQRWMRCDGVILSSFNQSRVAPLAIMLGETLLTGPYPQEEGLLYPPLLDEGFSFFSDGFLAKGVSPEALKNLKINGYIGVLLKSPQGKLIGVLELVSQFGFDLTDRSRDLLSIISAHASTEIERYQIERQLHHNERSLRHLAHHDPLTELPNRLLFKDRLETAMARCQKSGDIFGILFLDLDRFKNINDTLGHEIGDQMLLAVASRLEECLVGGMTLARLGGDEFAAVVEGIDHAGQLGEIAENLLKCFRQPFPIGGYSLYVTASIGISVYPQDSEDKSDLMKCADVAMFAAKDEGRNTYSFYQASMDKRAHELLLLENDLRSAMGKREFELYFQPTFALDTGKIHGFEALIRWFHPEKGMISPLDFIGLAEENGLIVPLGEWILETACQQIVDWNRLFGAGMGMAVNLSARQFHHYDLGVFLEGLLEHSGIDPAWLELEITESMLMYDTDLATQTMDKISAHGVRFAIDDFGTGYSSLARLKRFPVSTLKIDRSLIRDVLTDANDAAVAETILAMGRNLGLEIVAEGIEEQAQLDFLTERSCARGQGFFLGKPMDVETAKRFLEQNRDLIPRRDV